MNKEQIDQLAQRCWLDHGNNFDHDKLLAEVDKLRAEQEKPVAVVNFGRRNYIEWLIPADDVLRPGTNLFLHPQPIPEGYKLVPAEPTKEMCEAFWERYDCEHFALTGAYKAMLAAAPEVRA